MSGTQHTLPIMVLLRQRHDFTFPFPGYLILTNTYTKIPKDEPVKAMKAIKCNMEPWWIWADEGRDSPARVPHANHSLLPLRCPCSSRTCLWSPVGPLFLDTSVFPDSLQLRFHLSPQAQFMCYQTPPYRSPVSTQEADYSNSIPSTPPSITIPEN